MHSSRLRCGARQTVLPETLLAEIQRILKLPTTEPTKQVEAKS
jgi:hypothetical protein